MTGLSPHALSRQVGNSVQRLRKARRWSIADLAAALTAYGLPTTANSLENIQYGRRGKRRPVTVDEFYAFAEVFDVEPDALLRDGPTCDTCKDAPPLGFICSACEAFGGHR